MPIIQRREEVLAKRSAPGRLNYLPRRIIWAWEKAERLDEIDPHSTGVAFLTGVIRLQADSIQLNPRMQTLSFPSETRTIGVVRIECDKKLPPTLSDSQLQKVARSIVGAVSRHQLKAIQIDFDARLSERSFYKRLLKQLRHELMPDVGISMTALASWCMDDRWLAGLPVDEVVPMYFCMGAETPLVMRRLAEGKPRPIPPIKLASGVMHEGVITRAAARDRRLRARLGGARVYFFSPSPWTHQAVARTFEQMYRWR